MEMKDCFYTTIMVRDDEGVDPLLKNLIGADLDTLSPREQATYEKSMEYGESYWATIRVEGDTMTATTDLGSPDTIVRVVVQNPVSTEVVLRMLQAAVDAATD